MVKAKIINGQMSKSILDEYNEIQHSFSNYYFGKKKGLMCILDNFGNKLTDCIYTEIKWFQGDLFMCYATNWVLINVKNNIEQGDFYNDLVGLSNGIAVFRKNNEYIFINGYSQIVNKVKFYNKNAKFNEANIAVIQTEKGHKGLLRKNGTWSKVPAIL